MWQVDQLQPPDPQTTKSLAEQAVTLQETLGDQPEIASALVSLSEFMSGEEGLRLVQRALAIRRAAPRQPYLADIHTLGVLIDIQAQLRQPLDASLLAETVDHRQRALLQPPAASSGPYYARSLEALVEAIDWSSMGNAFALAGIAFDDSRTAAHGAALLNLAVVADVTSRGRESSAPIDLLREYAKFYQILNRDDQARELEAQAQALENQR